jgi:CheY-like chemotaxis protein
MPLEDEPPSSRGLLSPIETTNQGGIIMMSKGYENSPPKEDREVLNLSSSLKGLRVLVVDDNDDSLLLTSVILSEYGIEAMTASSARKAFKLFLEAKPDLLVCDIAMPYEDGYSLIRKIRKVETKQGGRIPAIALTGLATEEHRRLSVEAGFQVYLEKPFEAPVLVGIIAVLARQIDKWRSPLLKERDMS